MGFVNLLRVEMRRALRRRVVRVLVGLALLGTTVMGLVAFFDSAGKSVAELHANGTYPAVMADWWVAGSGEGILMIGAIPLLIGGLLGGASVAGAEWRAGTVTTVLTWEPRRLRLHAARTASAFLLAAVIAIALQTLFLAATLPAVLAHGTTVGTDRGWWVSLAAAAARISLLTGGTAVLGVSLATLGRNTTFALGAAFGWMAVGENLVRGFKPALQDLLMGENLAIAMMWGQLDSADFSRSEVTAVLTIVAYLGLVALAGASSFRRRDLAGAS